MAVVEVAAVVATTTNTNARPPPPPHHAMSVATVVATLAMLVDEPQDDSQPYNPRTCEDGTRFTVAETVLLLAAKRRSCMRSNGSA